MDPQPAPPQRARAKGQRRAIVPAAAAFAVAAVAAVLFVNGTGAPTAAGPTAAPTTTAAATTASPATTTAPTPTPGTPTALPDPVAERELSELAARIAGPVVLSSPPDWDRWLPGSRPYPGASTEEDMATCPRMAAALGEALETRMSYWTGTLPAGPAGCTWATVPLSYDGPYDYPYLAGVGFLADGTTTEQLRTGFFHQQGKVCPGIDAPTIGDGAVLVRCAEPGRLQFILAVRDARTAGGVWVFQGTAQADAAHPAQDVLGTLVNAAVSAYG